MPNGKKKTKTEKRKRYFGIVKLKSGQKMCWISKEDKNGWSLGLAINKRDVWLRGLRFPTRRAVENAMNTNIVFVYLKNTKALPPQD